ncbi:Protein MICRORCHIDIA 1 [Zea mays]|uniref:Protein MICRORCHIDIA 1 n=1 Tax=Zea mays TaxID=4577 RepID=A0A1D6J0Q4_MAIZE|nr:Protein MICRORCHIDIA 1 [Zea mays]
MRLETWSLSWRKQKRSAVSLLLSSRHGRTSSIYPKCEGHH